MKAVLLFLLFIERTASLNLVFLDEDKLTSNRKLYEDNCLQGMYYVQEELCLAAKRFASIADTALMTPPPSVVTKKELPPSKDPHDYYSQAVYYWPNPLFISTFPYIPKHGQPYPPALALPDKKNFQNMFNKASQLALWYFYSRDVKYAKGAIEFIRTWFIYNATAMNPNMNYASIIPGYNGLRGLGIIEIHNLVFLLDYLELVKPAGIWTAKDEAAFKDWLTRYFNWLLTDPAAQMEAARTNNHGTYCDLQLLGISLYLNKTSYAGQLVKTVQARLDSQMGVDGSFPLETAEARSFFESVFNLRGFFALATLAQQFGLDLWQYSPSGRSVEGGLIFLLNHITKWPFTDVDGAPRSQAGSMNYLLQMVVKARQIYGSKYDNVLAELSGGLTNVKHASQPVLQYYLTQVHFVASKTETYFFYALTAYCGFVVFTVIFYFGIALIFYQPGADHARKTQKNKLTEPSPPQKSPIVVMI